MKSLETKIQQDIEQMKHRIEAVEEALESGKISEEAARRFTDLENQIRALQMEKTMSVGSNVVNNQTNCTILFGGFKDVTAEQVEVWITSECGKLDQGKIVKQYFKGTWAHKMWVVFESTASRNAIFESIRKQSMWSCEGNPIWVKQDLPIGERIETSLLFGMKFLLNSWKYPRNSIWVDTSNKTISCGGELVATVEVKGKELVVDFGLEWGAWTDFTGDAKLQDLIKTSRDKLSNSVGTKGKGKGKEKE